MIEFILVMILLGYGIAFLMALTGIIFGYKELWPDANSKYPLTRQIIMIIGWPILFPYTAGKYLYKVFIEEIVNRIKKEFVNDEWWEKK